MKKKPNFYPNIARAEWSHVKLYKISGDFVVTLVASLPRSSMPKPERLRATDQSYSRGKYKLVCGHLEQLKPCSNPQRMAISRWTNVSDKHYCAPTSASYAELPRVLPYDEGVLCLTPQILFKVNLEKITNRNWISLSIPALKKPDKCLNICSHVRARIDRCVVYGLWYDWMTRMYEVHEYDLRIHLVRDMWTHNTFLQSILPFASLVKSWPGVDRVNKRFL